MSDNSGSPFRGVRKHRCPAVNCPAMIGSTSFMCAYHWRAVPGPMKRAVLVAWNDDPQGIAFVNAMDAAIRALTAATKKAAP